MTRSSPGSHAPPTTSPKQPQASSPPHKEELQYSTATSDHQPDSLVRKSKVFKLINVATVIIHNGCFFGQDGGEIFEKERESMASESASKFAKLID